MSVELLGTSIAEWLGVKPAAAPVAATWSEDELNALARGLGCSEHTTIVDNEKVTYFLSPPRKNHPLDAQGSRAIFAFGEAQRALGHNSYGAERLLREMCPELLTT